MFRVSPPRVSAEATPGIRSNRGSINSTERVRSSSRPITSDSTLTLITGALSGSNWKIKGSFASAGSCPRILSTDSLTFCSVTIILVPGFNLRIIKAPPRRTLESSVSTPSTPITAPSIGSTTNRSISSGDTLA